MSNNEYIWAHNKADNSFAYLSKSLEIILKNEVENNFNLLDIGCGNGFLTKDMSRYFKKVIGIDNSNSAISQAKKNYSGNITNSGWKNYYYMDIYTVIISQKQMNIVITQF